MHERDSVYQYTHIKSGTIFFATEKDAENMFELLGAPVTSGWKNEYISEVWQITGENTSLPLNPVS